MPTAVQGSTQLTLPSDQRAPRTHHVAVDQAACTLSYEDMLSLANMLHRWALTEDRISPDHRTRLMLLSADYERIAEFVGPGWQAIEGTACDAMAFLAQQERGKP